MKIIKVVYERDKVLLDENNDIIFYQMLPEPVRHIFHLGMNGHDMEYYQEIHDSYFAKLDVTLMNSLKGSPFYQDSEETFHQFRLEAATQLKALLPEFQVLFHNSTAYYDFPVNSEGFSEIPAGFDISSVILFKGEKKLKIMFDYEATGIWNFEGKCIPLEWVPCSQTTRDLISQFQHGLNRMRINYEDDYTAEENQESENYMWIGLQAAIALKKELPDWQINFYNYGCYFDLPFNPYNNCSEITSDLVLENIKSMFHNSKNY